MSSPKKKKQFSKVELDFWQLVEQSQIERDLDEEKLKWYRSKQGERDPAVEKFLKGPERRRAEERRKQFIEVERMPEKQIIEDRD